LDPGGRGHLAPVVLAADAPQVVVGPAAPHGLLDPGGVAAQQGVQVRDRVVPGAEDAAEVEGDGGTGRGAALAAHDASQVGRPSTEPVAAMVSVASRAWSKVSTRTTWRPAGSLP